MKISTYFQIVLVVVILVLLTGAPGISPVYAQDITPVKTETPAASCNTGRSVNVTGTAQINVIPDRAIIQLGVQSNGASVDAVQDSNNKAIQRVIAAIKAENVDPKDIATDVYSIEPVYENYDSLYIKGYRIYNTIAVTVRDVKKTSSVLAAALSAGANQVNDVSFYTSELRKYRDQARQLAMTAAKEKAQALASASGGETGCVLSINENSWSYYNGWWYGSNRLGSQMTQNVIQNANPTVSTSATSSGDEPVSLGQISVKAEVSASFALK